MIDSDAVGFLGLPDEPEGPDLAEVAQGSLDAARQVLQDNRVAAIAANAARIYATGEYEVEVAIRIALLIDHLVRQRLGES
jgi:hypothetical protein